MEETLIANTQLQFSETVKNYYPEILTDGALEFLLNLHPHQK